MVASFLAVAATMLGKHEALVPAGREPAMEVVFVHGSFAQRGHGLNGWEAGTKDHKSWVKLHWVKLEVPKRSKRLVGFVGLG